MRTALLWDYNTLSFVFYFLTFTMLHLVDSSSAALPFRSESRLLHRWPAPPYASGMAMNQTTARPSTQANAASQERGRTPSSVQSGNGYPTGSYKSRDEFVRDAGLIVAIWESSGAQAPVQVAHLLRREDFVIARVSLRMLPRARREYLQHHAQILVDGPYNPANFPGSFKHLIERFQAGPPTKTRTRQARNKP
jgi:hypothetical protein